MYPDEYLNKEDDDGVYWFSSPYDALNNWSAHAVEVYGKVFHTLEHAYHYTKFIDTNPEIANYIFQAPSPWAAMKVAREHDETKRSDWQDVKAEIMEELLRLKHAQNEDVQERLVATGSKMIYENSPWDSYWGVGRDGKGENMMGKLWVKIRDGK